jgi:hypothetical protein
MHPDDAVDLALQDLRSLTHPAAAVLPFPPARPASPLLMAWRRYMEGWKWYAAAELALPEPGPAFPPRTRATTSARSRRAVRVATRCDHHRFELLFGREAVAGCR